MDATSLSINKGAGVELTANNYPFVMPSTDVRNILADFWLSYEDRGLVPPFSISELRHFGRVWLIEPPGHPDEHICDLVVTDNNGITVCDTADGAYLGRPFGTRFYVHEWRLPTMTVRAVQYMYYKAPEGVDEGDSDWISESVAHDSESQLESDSFELSEGLIHFEANATYPHGRIRAAEDGHLRITDRRMVRILEQLQLSLPPILNPVSSVLDERTYELLPQRVLSLTVGTQRLTGNIRFQAGYNIAFDTPLGVLSVPSVPFTVATLAGKLTSNTSTITMAALAGAGLGSFNNCDPTADGLRTINKIAPNARGNFSLAASDCIYVAVPHAPGQPTALLPSTLQIGNQCGVCCPCSGYVSTYLTMQSIADRLNTLVPRVTNVRNKYEFMVEQVREQQADILEQPLQVSLTGGVKKLDNVYLAAVTVSVALNNFTAKSYVTPTLTLTMSSSLTAEPDFHPESVIRILDDGSARSDSFTGSWPEYTCTWDSQLPGHTVRAQFTVVWKSDAAISGMVLCTAHLTAGTVTVAPVTQTINLP